MMILYACQGCGHVIFPARLLCHRCGAADWVETPCEQGTVQETTVMRQGFGEPGASPVHLAAVQTAFGVTVIARLAGPSAPGATVTLTESADGAVLGLV